MSIRVIQDVWDHSQARDGALLVLLAIADSADPETREAWPTVKFLAAKCRLSERAVSYATKKLVSIGEIEVLERGGRQGPRGRANRYRVTLTDHTQDLQVDPITTCNLRHDHLQSATPLYSEPSLTVKSSLISPDEQAITEVFRYWQKVMEKPSSRLTRGRREKIRARLNSGATVGQIKRAIEGCAGSEFHTTNGHTDLTLICRSEEKLEQFAAMPVAGSDEDFFAGSEFA
jgi:hypothetical protein